MSFQVNLRNWLVYKYGDLTKACEILEVDASTLSRYFAEGKNSRKPNFDFLVKLIKEGCDLRELLEVHNTKVAESKRSYDASYKEASFIRSKIKELKKNLDDLESLINK